MSDINPEWYNFQERIKEHFQSLGADAETNQKIEGVRGKHNVDVLVKPKFFGRDITWLVEAKDWNSNIPKEKVLTFLQIMQDVGADRGFLISKIGFQSGAIECAKNTNLELTNFEELKETTKEFVVTEVIRHYEERFEILHARYWAHPKRHRREYGLRHELFQMSPFSGTTLLDYIERVFDAVKSKSYPFNTDTGLQVKAGNDEIADFQQACNWLNLNLNLLDRQLLKSETTMYKFGDFEPNIRRWREVTSVELEDKLNIIRNKEYRKAIRDGDFEKIKSVLKEPR